MSEIVWVVETDDTYYDCGGRDVVAVARTVEAAQRFCDRTLVKPRTAWELVLDGCPPWYERIYAPKDECSEPLRVYITRMEIEE